MQFRKDINGLRALAVVAVVLFHFDASLLTGGFAGVDVFFCYFWFFND
jgi:peptidoglycan/LPS O-acetylase OafA/YrhL